MNMPQQQQQPVIDLGQLKQVRQQQAVGRLQNKISIALQMFLHSKVNNIEDAFALAEEFIKLSDAEAMKAQEELEGGGIQ